jgi:hypothetical protein
MTDPRGIKRSEPTIEANIVVPFDRRWGLTLSHSAFPWQGGKVTHQSVGCACNPSTFSPCERGGQLMRGFSFLATPAARRKPAPCGCNPDKVAPRRRGALVTVVTVSPCDPRSRPVKDAVLLCADASLLIPALRPSALPVPP